MGLLREAVPGSRFSVKVPLSESTMARKIALFIVCWLLVSTAYAQAPENGVAAGYQVHPVGWIRKSDGRTLIEVDEKYRAAMLGLDDLDSIWVLYWFDRNDTPAKRAILQVHPRGNPDNPLRGVFATRAPVRPNLIALSRCHVLSVEGNIIEIDEIDAFADTPVLDIKP
jgi:tRNA-Thr(GGU) m(6)t(6)A37 methyltransferase TsaA